MKQYTLLIKNRAEHQRLLKEYSYFELTLVPRGNDYYTVEKIVDKKEEKEKAAKTPQRYKNKQKRNQFYEDDDE